MSLEDTRKKLQALAGITPKYTLYVFDFDGTLVNSHTPSEGKEIWKQKTGKSYPHDGWWGRPDSLNPDIFDIKPIETNIEAYKRAKSDKNALTIMLTSRIPKLKDVIMQILDKYNLKFDEYIFKEGTKEKTERIEELLKKYPEIKHIEIWDDRQKEIDLYTIWRRQKEKEEEKLPQEEKTKIIIHHV